LEIDAEDTFICAGAVIKGRITIEEFTLVYPNAVIDASRGGPIVIGSDNIIEDSVQIINTLVHKNVKQFFMLAFSAPNAMVIGDHNHFKSGCSM
jgi:carbonic anhydrase/acetyltransferase-like protein (isoleucine patch superfamily)